MSVTLMAVAFGIAISLINFLIVLFLSVLAVKKDETTSAAAIVVLGFAIRLPLLTSLFYFLAHNPLSKVHIMPILLGFISVHVVSTALDILVVVITGNRIEQRPLLKT